MTNLMGLARKRDVDFKLKRSNTTEYYQIRPKTSVFQTKTFQFCVIARPQRGRGNLKVKGMESQNEAREQERYGIPKRSTGARNEMNSKIKICPGGTPQRASKRHSFTQASACTSLAPASFTRASPALHFISISHAQYLSLARSANFTIKSPTRAAARVGLQVLQSISPSALRSFRSHRRRIPSGRIPRWSSRWPRWQCCRRHVQRRSSPCQRCGSA